MIITLNNSISNSILDYDAKEFITTCGVTNSQVVRNINDCFKELKKEDIWDCIFYGYAMVFSGSTQSMLVDIKSRQILSSSIPITGVTDSATYSNTGIKFNEGEYLISSFPPFAFPTNTNSGPGHISIYNRTNYNLLGSTFSSKHGFLEPLGGNEQSISFSSNGVSASLWNQNGPMSFTTSSTSGFFVFSNVDDNNGLTASLSDPYRFYLSRNGQVVGSQSSISNYHTLGSYIVVGAYSDILGNPSVRSFDEICWYSIGSGFGNDSISGRQIDINKQEKFYQIIQKLQISLGREILI